MMVNESYFVTHRGTKYPRRTNRRRKRIYDKKDHGKHEYQDTYGL
jgi:hypothetical protein